MTETAVTALVDQVAGALGHAGPAGEAFRRAYAALDGGPGAAERAAQGQAAEQALRLTGRHRARLAAYYAGRRQHRNDAGPGSSNRPTPGPGKDRAGQYAGSG